MGSAIVGKLKDKLMKKPSSKIRFETPWPKPSLEELVFYHTMTYADGETHDGEWTISDFSEYIGGYDIADKTVLDAGTATGFIAFSAEKAGAAEVTGMDMPSCRQEFRVIPYEQNMQNIKDLINQWDIGLVKQKKTWWYGWHKNNSNARCIYAPIADLYNSGLMFDVVIAGALIEHISDPVYAIGALAQVAGEAIIFPFTQASNDDNMMMKPLTNWDNPENFYTWWELSTGLYKRIFDNLGFDITFDKRCSASRRTQNGSVLEERPTIIARRRK